MGLFKRKKRPPCPICGGEVKGLFPRKFSDQYICKECFGYADLPDGVVFDMTLEEFLAYRAFRLENDLLRERFRETDRTDLSFYGTIIFDMENKLFCMNKKLDRKTIFEGKHLKSFTIHEDEKPLFEGSADELVCYTSTVPDLIEEATPMIHAWIDADEDDYVPSVSEPIRKFFAEFHFDHPYWETVKIEMHAPMFSSSCPSADDYLDAYRAWSNVFGRMSRLFMKMAFPDAPERMVDPPKPVKAEASEAPVDAVEEIGRLRELMEQGVMTEEEFTAKKRQLLGI